MINFDLFVLPFFLGLIFALAATGHCWYRWIRALPPIDRVRLRVGLRRPQTLASTLKEVFMEALLHRRMWQRNALLGYMHMSFALGWFLLIVCGNIESRFYSGTHLNAPYYPIFLKFFIHDQLVLFFEIYTVPGVFRILMDLLLLFVLSGLVLALFKRNSSKWFGMSRTTEFRLTDRIALVSLWCIFPMRLLAESLTVAYYGSGGGFLTQPAGDLLAWLIPMADPGLAYGAWWGYSLVLGSFFFTLPYSRYMHIPAEVLLIFFRHCGIQPGKPDSGFAQAELHACSRCGVCIDICQMNHAGIHDAQAVYFIRGARQGNGEAITAGICLVCGRCQEVCPVGIHADALRLDGRRKLFSAHIHDHGFLSGSLQNALPAGDVAYFSGCMSHLTPSVVIAMRGIMDAAGIRYVHIDRDAGICCGRPMMIAGKDQQASEMIEQNRRLIRETGASLLVTSCPICYRVFRESYHLPVRVVHHAQFILDLVKTGRIALQTEFARVAYHDPCDLGRGSGVYEAPRELIRKVADLVPAGSDGPDAPCCGGSLGMIAASAEQRNVITTHALERLLEGKPNVLATACPLCKKTFEKLSPVRVADLAELVYSAIPKPASGSFSAHSHQAVSSEAG